jgi:hypothetical protein
MANSPQFVSGSFPTARWLSRQIRCADHRGRKVATNMIVEEDPRIGIAPVERQARYQAVMRS